MHSTMVRPSMICLVSIMSYTSGKGWRTHQLHVCCCNLMLCIVAMMNGLQTASLNYFDIWINKQWPCSAKTSRRLRLARCWANWCNSSTHYLLLSRVVLALQGDPLASLLFLIFLICRHCVSNCRHGPLNWLPLQPWSNSTPHLSKEHIPSSNIGSHLEVFWQIPLVNSM